VAGRQPSLAFDKYVEPLQRTVSCVTDAVFSHGGYSAGKAHALTLARGVPVPLAGKRGLSIVVSQNYEIVQVQDKVRGPWKIHTLEYIYTLRNSDGPLLAYHWHPTRRVVTPHLHLYQSEFPKCHFPTGRMSLEEVLRMTIEDLEVKPIRKDWEAVLRVCQDAHEQYRTWPTSTPVQS